MRFTHRELLRALAAAGAVAAAFGCGGSERGAAREGGDPPSASRHPLDPLTEAEIVVAVDVLRASGRLGAGHALSTLALREPPKEQVLAFAPGDPIRRQALAVVVAPAAGMTSEAVIDLGAARLVSWRDVPGAHARTTNSEYRLVARLLRADSAWRRALRVRGIADLDSVFVGLWAYGTPGAGDSASVRRVRALPFYAGNSRNPFARPIEGVMAVVNVQSDGGRVERVMDLGARPLGARQELDSVVPQPPRPEPSALRIEQPDGPGFDLNGHEVRWQRWRFRYAVHPREGVVLHNVGYEDRGALRPVLYRASLSEMVVPYGDPAPTWSFRATFDLGEYDFGRGLRSLHLGDDVPTSATLLDAVLTTEEGQAHRRPGVAALYERDGGLLWRHDGQARRARELVVRSAALVGNYDYGLSWVFRQDGTLAVEVDLTGIMLVKGVAASRSHPSGDSSGVERYGHLVAPNIVATNHQHFFSFRLDFDVDGPGDDAVAELNTRALPAGGENPAGNAMVMEETVLLTERAARRELNMAASRTWKVMDSRAENELGQHPAYVLVPGENALPHLAPESPMRRRAEFITKHVWVTRYDSGQLYAAGDYPNQSRGGDGLPAWIADDAPIDGADVVVWYTMGVTHLPRPEDWPVMPVSRAGFALKPTGFFTRNPAMDVPAAR
ncbi:MAG: primary-amine oxidase [Gemmatimonadaceae bacterium]